MISFVLSSNLSILSLDFESLSEIDFFFLNFSFCTFQFQNFRLLLKLCTSLQISSFHHAMIVFLTFFTSSFSSSNFMKTVTLKSSSSQYATRSFAVLFSVCLFIYFPHEFSNFSCFFVYFFCYI